MSRKESDFDLDGFVGNLSDPYNVTNGTMGPPAPEPVKEYPVTSQSLDTNQSLELEIIPRPNSLPSANWVPENALESLVEERSDSPGSSNLDIAKKSLEDNAPLAVASIVNLAMYSRSEAVRLRASQYIVDKAFEANSQAASALETFFKSVESYSNGNGKES